MQRKLDDSSWFDEVWAEGGVVVDWDNRTLLLFGGEDIVSDISLRRLSLKLLAVVWQNWKIKWTYEEIADIADYVNYPLESIKGLTEK